MRQNQSQRNNASARNILVTYFMRHAQAALNSLGQLSRTPFNTCMTCVVIGIALALPTALFVLLKNVEILSQHIQQTTQITLYLKQNITQPEINSLLQKIKNNPAVNQTHFVSPDQGLVELQQQAGIENVLTSLNSNPLPWAIVVLPTTNTHSPAALTHLSQIFKTYPEVESVQLDMRWAERLFAMIALAHRFVYALTIFLGIGVLLIVNNCIRSATQHNKKEIDVIKLVGGTHAFIRRPFLYAGIIYGLLGSIIAWELVDLMVLWLQAPSHHLANLYQSQFQILGITIHNTIALLFSSIALGLAGSWLAVTRHLRATSW
jgi:cell division transport system permease protein